MERDSKKQVPGSEVAEVVSADPTTAVEQQPAISQIPPVSSQMAANSNTEIAPAVENAPTVPTAPLANFEAVVEQLSHGMVDKDLNDADRQFLQLNGYKAMPIIRGKREFVMRTFLPTQEGKPPIVAFRGTVPSKVQTVIADLDPSGIGMYQFNPNRDVISGQMEAAGAHGAILSSGHSLGGALAQIAAATFPDLVGSIVTFQAPGVSRATAQALQQYNEENPDKAIMSSHHRVQGDLVPSGGQALTPGTVHNHQLTGGNLLTNNALSKHLVLPLAQEELAAGNVLPVQNEQTVVPTGDVSVEEDNAQKSQLIEMARTGLGTLVYGTGHVVIGIRDAAGHFISATGNVIVQARDALGNAVIGVRDAAGNVRDAAGNLLRWMTQ